MAFDHIGTGFLAQVAVNAAAFAVLFAVAVIAAWAKRAPWKGLAPLPAPVVVPPPKEPAPSEDALVPVRKRA